MKKKSITFVATFLLTTSIFINTSDYQTLVANAKKALANKDISIEELKDYEDKVGPSNSFLKQEINRKITERKVELQNKNTEKEIIKSKEKLANLKKELINLNEQKESPLVIEKNNLLGAKLLLSPVNKKLISATVSTDTITDLILNTPSDFFEKNKQLLEEETDKKYTEAQKKDFTDKNPLRFFNSCVCMPKDPVYISFGKDFATYATDLYKTKDPNRPFVYGTFACGGLFPDLYILTNFIRELRSQGIKDIYLQVNLIDTDLRDYIFKHTLGLGKSASATIPVHSHMLSYKPTSEIEYSSALDATDLIVSFLQWFNQNLEIKLDLYVYGTGQDYVYDHEKKKMASHDVLVAIDYYPDAQADLGQLALRTIKLNGQLFSLNNKYLETIKGVSQKEPSSYKELDEIIKKEKQDKKLQTKTPNEEKKEEVDTEDALAYTVISKKYKDISTETFKDLLKKARGDSRKIGILFDPIIYPNHEFMNFQSKKKQAALKFNPLDYFEIIYKKELKY